MSDRNDPRDASLETKLTLPAPWYKESFETGLQTSGMFLSGLIMVTRNRFIAWPALVFAINATINQHPLRAKEGSGGQTSNLLLCVTALIAAYIPMFMVTKVAPPATGL